MPFKGKKPTAAAVRKSGATSRKPVPESPRRGQRFKLDLPAVVVPWPKVAGVFFAAVVLLGVAFGLDPLVSRFDRPVALVEVRGAFRYLQAEQLEDQLRSFVGKSFLATDLEQVKATAEAVPWVYSASVQRVWPDRLVVQVGEQQPAARWNGERLLNVWGEIFTPASMQAFEDFADLRGPDSEAVQVLSQFAGWHERLITKEIVLRGVELEARGAWNLVLENQVLVRLGREQVDERLGRFVKAYEKALFEKVERIAQVDVRYTNGVAVRWKADAIEDGKVRESGAKRS